MSSFCQTHGVDAVNPSDDPSRLSAYYPVGQEWHAPRPFDWEVRMAREQLNDPTGGFRQLGSFQVGENPVPIIDQRTRPVGPELHPGTGSIRGPVMTSGAPRRVPVPPEPPFQFAPLDPNQGIWGQAPMLPADDFPSEQRRDEHYMQQMVRDVATTLRDVNKQTSIGTTPCCEQTQELCGLQTSWQNTFQNIPSFSVETWKPLYVVDQRVQQQQIYGLNSARRMIQSQEPNPYDYAFGNGRQALLQFLNQGVTHLKDRWTDPAHSLETSSLVRY